MAVNTHRSFLTIPDDPKTLLGDAPCNCCLTPHQLLAMKVKLMCDIVEDAVGTTCDIDTAQADSKCYACYSDQQLDMIELAVICALAVAAGARTDCTTQTLMDEVNCLKCYPEHQLKAMWVYLLQEWVSTLAPA